MNRFSHYKSMGIFKTLKGSLLKTAVGGQIWPNFELFRALMHVIIICMYEKGGMKNNRAKVATSFKTLKGR